MILLKAAEWERESEWRKKLVFTLVSLSDVLSAKKAEQEKGGKLTRATSFIKEMAQR